MLSVTIKSIVLNVILLSVVMLNVVAPIYVIEQVQHRLYIQQFFYDRNKLKCFLTFGHLRHSLIFAGMTGAYEGEAT
jgi:hypothetical protein